MHLACMWYSSHNFYFNNFSSHSDKTPLLCAAEAGRDEIVAYLLQFRKVRTDLKNQPEEVHSARVSYSDITCMNDCVCACVCVDKDFPRQSHV